MNRLESGDYPETICGVVGQKNQFAPGVLSRPMNSKALPDVLAAAEAVLEGERHPEVKEAKFFHQAGLTFPYKNMHYVLEAGGNAFYEKRSRRSKAAETEVASQKPAASGAVLSYGAGVEASAAAGMLDHVLPKEAPVPSRLPGA
jgi:spore germination cell wall hydrolase CwlJ-like protein